jgi:Glycosyl transferase family 2
MSKPLRLIPQAAQPIEFSCPICASVHAAYNFGTAQFRIYRCAGCAFTFSHNQFRGVAPSSANDAALRMPVRTEEDHESLIAAIKASPMASPVLLVASVEDGIAPLLKRREISVGRIIDHTDFESNGWGGSYATAIVCSPLMRVLDPKLALEKIRRHLEVGGRIILNLPLLDTPQARLMGLNWHVWQADNRWYFSRETLNLLLLGTGFEQVWFCRERRRYSIEDLTARTRGLVDRRNAWVKGVNFLRCIAPKPLRRKQFRLPSGTSVVTATAAPPRIGCTVSIVVPVFNEAATLRELMDALLAKTLAGMRKEVIIVESNSKDGSRAIVESYASHPDVKIILQPAARGKGFAVREGLKAATGDIVMIQDADLEYDLEDYDGLLAPLLAGQSMFVLGSRHQGGWKMRQFSDAPALASLLNLGHRFFRSLINLAVHAKMDDPFTMYKVIRRDALYGIEFVCNRFDFDIELVIKLVRKGYQPLELPVNYVSRSFAEGKKVSIWRDGATWIWTIFKMRVSPLGKERA